MAQSGDKEAQERCFGFGKFALDWIWFWLW